MYTTTVSPGSAHQIAQEAANKPMPQLAPALGYVQILQFKVHLKQCLPHHT